MKIPFVLCILLTMTSLSAQLKILDHEDLEIWNVIKDPSISGDGRHVAFSLEQGEKDNFLKLYNDAGELVFSYDRASKAKFSHDSRQLVFTIKSWQDSILSFKRQKIDKKDLPQDTLGIYDITSGELLKIPGLKSYLLPQKWAGLIAISVADIVVTQDSIAVTDTTVVTPGTKNAKSKSKSGNPLLLYYPDIGRFDTIDYVSHYLLADRSPVIGYITTNTEEDSLSTVWHKDITLAQTTKVHSVTKARFQQLAICEKGSKIAVIYTPTSPEGAVGSNELWHWERGQILAIQANMPQGIQSDYTISGHGKLFYSPDERKLFYGVAPPVKTVSPDLLSEEIVNVEVWTYDEPVLYTVQEMRTTSDTSHSYQSVIWLERNNTSIRLVSGDMRDIELGKKGDADVALVSSPTAYARESQWTGRRLKDYQLISMSDGAVLYTLSGQSDARLSPSAKYIYGYNEADSTWYAINVQTKKQTNLTRGMVFYDEENDSPDYPSSYRAAGWTDNDQYILLYDRYDLWRFNPDNGQYVKLTDGRTSKTQYRYIKLDEESTHLSLGEAWLLSVFNEKTKDAGFSRFDPSTGLITVLMSGAYRFNRPQKAQQAGKLLYTRESFIEFPDLWLSDANMSQALKISTANPQQAEYRWGTSALYTWTSLDGIELTGLLIKPSDFDPDKQYPMLVNFYERSSDGLHQHRAPKAERSSINYSFYVSRGYVIFNPDVHYRIGYPGESAYNCVIPGVTALIREGFIDRKNIGIQGHSWGGYQIAYIVTRSDIFKAAESGAPVVNMFSAYSGIRWETGLARQFQYEHQQSRIGGSPWEYPIRFIENSPLFSLDKVNTPVLIMHNDADGHVPWYQGIEFFLGLRRLSKPAWFLNYNGEPHWPLKLQNRKDFNIRMAQFFDYYLKSAPKPAWMHHGVPAKLKGIEQGYELIEDR